MAACLILIFLPRPFINIDPKCLRSSISRPRLGQKHRNETLNPTLTSISIRFKGRIPAFTRGRGSILAPPPPCPSLGFGASPPFAASDMTFLFQACPQPLISAATYAAATPAFTGTRGGAKGKKHAVAPRRVSNQAGECTAMSVCESTQMFTCVLGRAAARASVFYSISVRTAGGGSFRAAAPALAI